MNVVKKEKCFAGCDLLLQDHFKIGAYPSDLEITFEKFAEIPVSFKINDSDRIKPLFSEFFERPCFADLASAPENQWFTAQARLPELKIVIDESSHGKGGLVLVVSDLIIQGKLTIGNIKRWG